MSTEGTGMEKIRSEISAGRLLWNSWGKKMIPNREVTAEVRVTVHIRCVLLEVEISGLKLIS